jgi:DNA-binding response OmpR family regulator
MMSGRKLPMDRAWAEEIGANEFLEKPFTHEQFQNQVNALLSPSLFATDAPEAQE